MIDEVVSPVLHNKEPVAVVESVDVPLQSFTTVTTGVACVDFGAAIPPFSGLIQPFSVLVTL